MTHPGGVLLKSTSFGLVPYDCFTGDDDDDDESNLHDLLFLRY